MICCPLNLTDPASGEPPSPTGGEVEPTVSLLDVSEHQLLAGFQPEVLAELAAPAEEVGGQQDGGGQAALLRHPVGLHQVGLDGLVPQEVQAQAGELKYQEIVFTHHHQTYIPCRQHSGKPHPGGGGRCVRSSPCSAPALAWDTPDTAPGPSGPARTKTYLWWSVVVSVMLVVTFLWKYFQHLTFNKYPALHTTSAFAFNLLGKNINYYQCNE